MSAQVVITRVETIPLHVPFRTPFKISSGGARPVGEILLVKLHTDAGLVGVGETQAWRRQGSVETLPGLVAAVRDHLAPQIVGRSPLALPPLLAALDEALHPAYYAKAAVVDALYDLQGKLLGLPVHQLFGGKTRDRVGVCAVLTIKDDPALTLEDAQRFYDRGFRAFTVKVGLDEAADVRNVRILRERFPAAVIRVDANAALDFPAALRLLVRLEPFDVDAAEQLVAAWNVAGMAELARRTTIPLMLDESVGSVHDLLNAIRLDAGTIVQTKVAKNGGLANMRRLWTIADAAGWRIYPGNHPSTGVATASVVQLAASWAGPLLDGPFAVGVSGAFAEDILAEPLRIEDGAVLLPDGPGLGVVLDDDKVAALRVDG